MKDTMKNVREDFLSDAMSRNELTTSESDINVKPKASVKVIISDSRLTVRTPHSKFSEHTRCNTSATEAAIFVY